MSAMKRIVRIDQEKLTFTAEAGLQFIEASRALRAHKLQFLTNIEIGNMTLGAAACCHTKDGLDGGEFGQVGSYVTQIKWVTPAGELAEASETDNPKLLRLMRSSYGLCGVVYEVTFRIKPLEAIAVQLSAAPDQGSDRAGSGRNHRCLERADLLDGRPQGALPNAKRIDRVGPFGSLIRGRAAQVVESHRGQGRPLHRSPNSDTSPSGMAPTMPGSPAASCSSRRCASLGGATLYNPDKTIDYSGTRPSAKYAFTFWAFPRAQWLGALREYLVFSEQHFKKYDFRCNMALGSYFIRKDTSSLLSYTHDGDIFSIDPIHAYTDKPAWDRFLNEFNEFAYKRNGIPLLNQSPFVERRHVEAAYGARWAEFSQWVRQEDPGGRMLNPFFAGLLS